MEWHVIQRVKDRRHRWPLIDGGLFITGRCASRNAAALISAVFHQADRANGQVYHAADYRQFTEREWITAIADMLGHKFDFIDLPPSIAPLGTSAIPMAGELFFSQCRQDFLDGRLRRNIPSPAKAMVELGYNEQVNSLTWLKRTFEFWLSASMDQSSEKCSYFMPGDFDYQSEDALMDWWTLNHSSTPTFGHIVNMSHPYDHPVGSV